MTIIIIWKFKRSLSYGGRFLILEGQSNDSGLFSINDGFFVEYN